LGRLVDHRKQQEKVLFSLILAVIVIMLTLYLWLVDRHVAKPAQRASYLADVIDNAQRVAKFGTWDWESKGEKHFWSDGLYKILNLESDYIPSLQQFLNALHEDDRERVKSVINGAIVERSPFELEARLRLAGDRVRVVQIRGQVSEAKHDHNVRMTSIIYDVTEQKESEKRLTYLANYDILTGLPNRNLFHDRLKHAMAQSERSKKQVGLLYLDLDHFKSVNDALGHQIGDLLLIEASDRITHQIRGSDTAARLGGDEFTVILEQVENIQQIVPVAENILSALNEGYNIEAHEVFVSASMGITLYPADGDDVDGLLKNADAAMYLAKEQGRNTYHFFTEELNRLAQEKLTLKNSLRMALERDEFYLQFQPQIELSSGRVIGAEALLRWSPNQNPVSPARFIPVLEETGLIVKVGQWVLEQACITAKQWQDQKGYKDFRIAVNLSARQLHQANIVEIIKESLTSSGLAAEYLEIELTESTLIDESISQKNLQQLERLGVNIAIDDFGTGYSSLSYLKQYSVDVLKIDRSFIQDITHDSDDDAVTSAIVALSHKLGMKVIAEGLETPEQYKLLRQASCDQAQGFFVGRPMVKHYFEQWMGEYFDEKSHVAYWRFSNDPVTEPG
jgi:diguanylate cyclase (GGDEF)-like protein